MRSATDPLCRVQVPVPTVTEQERLLFQKMPYAGVYRCVVRCECRVLPVICPLLSCLPILDCLVVACSRAGPRPAHGEVLQPHTECVVYADGYHDVVNQGQEFVKTLLEKVGCFIQTVSWSCVAGLRPCSHLRTPSRRQIHIACPGGV